MNYHSLFSTLSLALLLQVSSTFLLSSCSDQKPLQQNSSLTSSQVETQENLSGISKTIQDKAKQFTVRIDYPDGNGSGVIVAKNGETYYVLTAKHVVEQDQEYKLVTPDEKEYNVDASKIKKPEGADLAVLQFHSEEMYQVATLADYESESEENLNPEKQREEIDKTMKESGEKIEKLLQDARTKDMSPEEIVKIMQENSKKLEEQMQKSEKEANKDMRKLQEPQSLTPWLFLLGWSRFNDTPQLRLSAGKNFSYSNPTNSFGKDKAQFASSAFDSQAQSQNYGLSYTNFSQGGMSGGAVLDTTARVIGIHAAAEGEITGLKEIQLGFSLGIPIGAFLPLVSQVGIKPEWLNVETIRPKQITKEDEQSIAQNLFEIEPPKSNATEADWLNYGNDLWRIEHYQKAIVAFDEAIKIKPDFYQAYFGKGLAVKMSTSKKYSQEISSVMPDKVTSHETLTPDPDYFSPEKSQERQKILAQNMEQLHTKTAETTSSYAQRYAKALSDFKKASEINPDFYPAWREQGVIQLQLALSAQDMEIAQDMNMSIAEATKNGYPPLSPKQALVAKEALAAFNKATALNPSDAQLYSLKAQLLERLSRDQEAIDAYSKAIQIHPSFWNYGLRSFAYCHMGDKQKAEADMENAEKLGYQNAAKDLPICPN
jgi:tetratricopeptide (TPR) repeat protein